MAEVEYLSGGDFLLVVRVSYGKDNTPQKDREYNLPQGGPVGTRGEWSQWAKDNDYKGLRLLEKDGSVTFMFFN